MKALSTLLRIKGYATILALAQSSGLNIEAIEGWASEQTALGHCDTTRMGLRLTPLGRDVADAVTMTEREGLDASEFEATYADFEGLNGTFKHLVSAWQVCVIDGCDVLNDHSDAAYDQGIIAQLDAVHIGIMPVVAQLGSQLERLGYYGTRFERALEALKNGDLRHMAAPIIDSYHTIWFELHEDLIRLSGRSRAQEAAAGRAS